MTRYLPPNLLNLFAARPVVEYVAPVSKRRMLPYSGVAQCMTYFSNPTENPPPEPLKLLNRDERNALKRKEKQEKERQKVESDLKEWDPHNNPKATDEAYKTLFVCRLSYNTSESKLRREFEQYGPIKQIKLTTDLDNKPRGYAFIEFERERDMRDAYKAADAKKIDDRRILVDVERGRTVKDWKPRRFGGGLGGTRLGSERVNVRLSGRQSGRDDDRGRRDDDRPRDDRPRDDRPRDDRPRDDRPRSDRHRDDRVRDDRHRDDRHRDDRHREDRHREDRHREGRHREERHREDRHREDRHRDERKRDDRKDRIREEGDIPEEKAHEVKKERSHDREDKKEKRDREHGEEVDDRNVRSRKY